MQGPETLSPVPMQAWQHDAQAVDNIPDVGLISSLLFLELFLFVIFCDFLSLTLIIKNQCFQNLIFRF